MKIDAIGGKWIVLPESSDEEARIKYMILHGRSGKLEFNIPKKLSGNNSETEASPD